MKGKLLLLAVVMLALAGCGSSGPAVPNVGNRTLEQGYALLRSKGFRVSVAYTGLRVPFGLSSLEGIGIRQTVPAAGTHVAPGSVVTLFPYYSLSGDPVVVGIHPKRYRLPDFAGRSPGVAMRWADRHYIYWQIRHLPQLHASTARNFFAAYVVTAERPAAGGVLPESGWLTLTVRPRR